MVRLFLGIGLLIVLGSAAVAQSANGFGRPPGFGPELDQRIIAQMNKLRSFLANDLGFVDAAPPESRRIRSGLFRRNFLAWLNLDGVYQAKYTAWHNELWAIDGITQLGVLAGDLRYNLHDEYVDFHNKKFGAYHGFQSVESAEKTLKNDCSILDRMARDYIRLLQARLDAEARQAAPRPAADPSMVRAGREAPRVSGSILDVMSEGEVKQIIERRKRR